MIRPQLCHPPAFQLLASSLARIESTAGLVHAAIAVSLHAFDDVIPEHVEAKLDGLSLRVQRRVRGGSIHAKLAHLHDVLFGEEGFIGDAFDPSAPLNRYLPVVLETRKGAAISLCLVYKAVAERVGIPVIGLNVPGHFLVKVVDAAEQLVVDPFSAGRMLSHGELARRFGRCDRSADAGASLPVATHRQWISRLIGDLQHAFSLSVRSSDLAAMTELQDLVSTVHACG